MKGFLKPANLGHGHEGPESPSPAPGMPEAAAPAAKPAAKPPAQPAATVATHDPHDSGASSGSEETGPETKGRMLQRHKKASAEETPRITLFQIAGQDQGSDVPHVPCCS